VSAPDIDLERIDGLLAKMDLLAGALRMASMLRYLHENTAGTVKLGGEALVEGAAEVRSLLARARRCEELELLHAELANDLRALGYPDLIARVQKRIEKRRTNA
jgi:hypothetical protein